MFREYFRTRRILREARRIEKANLRKWDKANREMFHTLRVTDAALVIARDCLDRNVAQYYRDNPQ
jgi:hypothetical protein